MNSRFGAWMPPLVWMGAIFYLSSRPDPAPQVTSLVWDKLLHALAYAGLAWLYARALLSEGFSPPAAALLALLLASAYGATDELHQRIVPGRVGDAFDWLADTVGAAAGGAMALRARGPRGSGTVNTP